MGEITLAQPYPDVEAPLKTSALIALLTVLPSLNALADTPGKQTPPKDGMIKVAVVVSGGANLMDLAGPWEVFQDTMLADGHGNDISPFELYTVAPSKEPLSTTGSNRPGLTITPDYSFADAPTPDIVVIGAQSGGPGLSAWLQKIHGDHRIIMSVCTGAFKVAEAGLLSGKQATTHHWYFGNFADQFPDVKLERQVRYAQADATTFSAGGLSSGIDLALHIVTDYFGAAEAQKTADFMEYQGTGWKSNQGISEMTTPVKRQDWTGSLRAGGAVVLHSTTRGASPSFSMSIERQKVADAPVTMKQSGNQISFTVRIEGHPATFTGQLKTDGVETPSATGTFVQDGQSFPLTLVQQPATW